MIFSFFLLTQNDDKFYDIPDQDFIFSIFFKLALDMDIGSRRAANSHGIDVLSDSPSAVSSVTPISS